MSDAANANANVFYTHPDKLGVSEATLAHAYRNEGVPRSSAKERITLTELPFLGHLLLRGGAITLDEALRSVLGMSLPAQPLGLNHDEKRQCSVQWLSPDEWLLIVPRGQECDVEQKLRRALGDDHYAITNVSGGQTLVSLEGRHVQELLQKSVVYDVHPDNFPVGKGVNTVFAKTTVNLRKVGEQHWELVIRRSFSNYIYRWLLDAAAEYGIEVVG